MNPPEEELSKGAVTPNNDAMKGKAVESPRIKDATGSTTSSRSSHEVRKPNNKEAV
jgi:hypothetical protein